MKEAQVEADLAEQEVAYASRKEVEAAAAALSPADRKRLIIFAKFWCEKFYLSGTDMQPADLLQEALLRALEEEGGRRWPKHITFVKFLDRSMESIAGHHRGSMKAEGDAKRATRSLEPPPPKKGVSDPAPIYSDSAEEELAAKDEVERLREFFGDDTQGFRAVWCRALEMSTEEILQDLGIDSKEWETVRKRVQRKLAKYVAAKEEEQ